MRSYLGLAALVLGGTVIVGCDKGNNTTAPPATPQGSSQTTVDTSKLNTAAQDAANKANSAANKAQAEADKAKEQANKATNAAQNAVNNTVNGETTRPAVPAIPGVNH